MNETQLDVIAVGAHPDDVEIGCGGTLARLVEQGYRVGIIDLTDGEPTPGSSGRDVRLDEARRAADALGVHLRVTLDLTNRRLFDTFDARAMLATEFRRYRPRLVLGLGNGTPTASPDHHQAMLITEAAIFSTKLSKWDEQFGGLPPYHIARQLQYYLEFRALAPGSTDRLVFDIGDALEKKIAAIACYESQFGKSPETLARFRIFAQQQGLAAGFSAGEVLGSPTALGTRDLMGFLFP
jgi:LmbE family N-acetylglucosaminyl deacetylase